MENFVFVDCSIDEFYNRFVSIKPGRNTPVRGLKKPTKRFGTCSWELIQDVNTKTIHWCAMPSANMLRKIVAMGHFINVVEPIFVCNSCTAAPTPAGGRTRRRGSRGRRTRRNRY